MLTPAAFAVAAADSKSTLWYLLLLTARW